MWHADGRLRAVAATGRAARPHWQSTSALYRLDFSEFGQSMRTKFTAIAGLLVATERLRGIERAAIDVHHAGAHAAGNPFGPRKVTAPNAARQAVGFHVNLTPLS